MIKLKKISLILSRLSGDRWTLAVLVSLLPMLVLMGFGLGLAFKYGYLLVLSLTITLTVISVVLILFLAKVICAHYDKKHLTHRQAEQPLDAHADLVSPSTDWSNRELAIWQQTKIYSRELLANNAGWSDMEQKALLVFNRVAKEYNKQYLDFSIAEGLKLLEEVSRRYRLVLKEHIPLVDIIKVSHLKSGYGLYDKYGELGPVLFDALRALNYAKNIVINPAKAASDFIKQQFSSNMTAGLVDGMQHQAKAALLDEVTAVAINLYSARFSIEQQDVSASATLATDKAFLAPTLEPIRIAIIGQVGAGKSSLTNLLNGEFAVEVGVLATTSGITVCETQLGDAEVKIVDLPGLDGKPETAALILTEYLRSDLVLWLVKANQPARELDLQLKQKINQHYAQQQQLSRKEPTVICIVNQVDMLKPAHDWQPPYDLTDTRNEKATIISQALAYNKALLTPDFTVALSIAEHKSHFGVEDLKLLLSEQWLNAYNVQLNRNRKDAIHKRVKIREQASRVGRSGRALLQGVFKQVKEKYRNPPQ